jgi:hypothetical protein
MSALETRVKYTQDFLIICMLKVSCNFCHVSILVSLGISTVVNLEGF